MAATIPSLSLDMAAIKAYRRKTRTSLPWRLAGSHFGTVLLSVLMICLVGIVFTLISTRVALPKAAEAALEAEKTSRIVDPFSRSEQLSNQDLSVLFKAMAVGSINYNLQQEDISIQATIGEEFKHIRSISLVGKDGIVVASSDPTLLGQSASTLDPTGWKLVQRALNGETTHPESHLAGKRADGKGIVGTAPVLTRRGQLPARS